MSSMRAYTSFPVDDDVVDRILNSLPDFQSLQATILICKSVHAVFQRHPISIMRHVAFNLVGPAWPLALRVLRSDQPDEDQERDEEEYDSDDDNSSDNSDNDSQRNKGHTIFERHIPSEGDSLTVPLTMREGKELGFMGRVASGLEDIFSQRYKDRSFAVSQLTGTESYKFQRALYRCWAFSQAFSVESAGFDPAIDSLMQTRMQFLDAVGTCGLLEMWEVFGFLKDTISWTTTASAHGGFSALVAESIVHRGPDYILDCFQNLSTPNWSPTDAFLSHTLNRIRQDRKIKDDAWAKQVGELAILDSVLGKADVCDHCHGPGGLQLWSEPNWPLLAGVIGPDVFRMSLPGRLQFNQRYQTLTNPYDFRSPRSLPAGLGQMFAQEAADNGNGGGGWQKDQWICTPCVKAFIKEHVVGVVRDRMVEADVPIQEELLVRMELPHAGPQTFARQ